jgi:predicted amino acid dehydrogenase
VGASQRGQLSAGSAGELSHYVQVAGHFVHIAFNQRANTQSRKIKITTRNMADFSMVTIAVGYTRWCTSQPGVELSLKTVIVVACCHLT